MSNLKSIFYSLFLLNFLHDPDLRSDFFGFFFRLQEFSTYLCASVALPEKERKFEQLSNLIINSSYFSYKFVEIFLFP